MRLASLFCSTVLFFIVVCFGCQSIENKSIEEVVIIGGGLMGSSTSWHLADQDVSVLLLEQQDSIYRNGSSYGETRIARSSNRGNDMWSYLHNTSVKETEYLISYLNAHSDKVQGYSMDDIYATNPVTYVGRTSIYDKLYASLIRQNVDYEMAVSKQEGREKFQVNLPKEVLIQREYNKYSGTMNPEKLIHYLHEGIRKKGGRVSYQRKVNNISHDPKTKLYEIYVTNLSSGEEQIIYSRKVVSAAGPYSGELLNELAPYFNSLIQPQRVFLAFLTINPSAYNLLTKAEKGKLQQYYPVINSSTGTRDGSFFSMLEGQDEQGGPIIKIGGHFQRSDISDLDKVWEIPLTEEEIAWGKNGTKRYFNLLDLPLEMEDLSYKSGYSCVYSLTETEVPINSPIIN